MARSGVFDEIGIDDDMRLALTDIAVDTEGAIKLPIDGMPALGAGLSALTSLFRSVGPSGDCATLLKVTDKFGNPLDPAILNSDGAGLLGSYLNSSTKELSQARFHVVDSDVVQSVSSISYDPTMLFMAAALAQVNQKLDAIQETVDEMFEYLRQKDKAEVRGNVRILEGVLEEYKHNWNNEIWRKSAHMKTMDIKQESEKSIVHLRAQIKGKIVGRSFAELRLAMDGRLEEVLDRLKEYQLAVYTYSFASFLEPMLSGNFSEENIAAVVAKIGDHGNEYRELYTACYDAIEGSARGSIDSLVLGGVAAAATGLGGILERVPLVGLTPIDEVVSGAGRGLEGFNDEMTSCLMGKLCRAKAPDLRPFQQSLETVSVLCNHPYQLAVDEESVYLLP